MLTPEEVSELLPPTPEEIIEDKRFDVACQMAAAMLSSGRLKIPAIAGVSIEVAVAEASYMMADALLAKRDETT